MDGDDAVLLDEKRTLRYEDSYPNGKDCPGHCRVATTDLLSNIVGVRIMADGQVILRFATRGGLE